MHFGFFCISHFSNLSVRHTLEQNLQDHVYTNHSPYLFDKFSGLSYDVGSSEAHNASHLHGVPARPEIETASGLHLCLKLQQQKSQLIAAAVDVLLLAYPFLMT